jgi:MFS family permease
LAWNIPGEYLYLMPDLYLENRPAASRGKFNFGWVVVAACGLMVALTYGLIYSYSVFFKPLADHFMWDRATVSFIYSASLLIRGAIAIGIGWLADRYGPIKISIFCGIMIGLGMVLSSQVQTLWQFFLTYAVLLSIGLSGAFGIGTAIVTRWFIKKPGLALAIVSSGSGLGTLFIVPGAERLVDAFGLAQALIVFGAVAGVLMIVSAFFLRSPPSEGSGHISAASMGSKAENPKSKGTSIREALGSLPMLLLQGVFLLLFFCIQMVMVHLVNFATDSGITPLVAATFVSLIGAVSILGRLAAGFAADRTGINNTLIFTCFFVLVSFILLLLTRSLWMFYLFALVFGFTYGSEVPQIPLFLGRFFGTKSLATMIGLTLFIGNIGGALGPWVAGKIFDSTHQYQWAFVIGAAAALISICLAVLLKRQSPPKSISA